LLFAGPIRKRSAIDLPLEAGPSSSKVGRFSRALPALPVERTISDPVSVASVTSSTLPGIFHDPYPNDPVMMQLSFLGDLATRQHQEIMRRIEEIRRVQIAQLEQFKRGGEPFRR
jgi:hypothetical protein